MIPSHSHIVYFFSFFPFQYLSSFISFPKLKLSSYNSSFSILFSLNMPESSLSLSTYITYYTLLSLFFSIFSSFAFPFFPSSSNLNPSFSRLRQLSNSSPLSRNIVPFLSPNLLTFSHSLHYLLSPPNITVPKNYPPPPFNISSNVQAFFLSFLLSFSLCISSLIM